MRIFFYQRETEQRENLAMTIRSLRSNETKHSLEIVRLYKTHFYHPQKLTIFPLILIDRSAFEPGTRTWTDNSQSRRVRNEHLRQLSERPKTLRAACGTRCYGSKSCYSRCERNAQMTFESETYKFND